MKNYFVILFLLVFVSSCYKVKTYPPEPKVEYKSFSIDTIDELGNITLKGTLKFHFIDGDGDLGNNSDLDSSDNEININLFINILRKQDGVYQELEDELEIDYNYRIPYFETAANNPTLKGDVIVREISLKKFADDTVKLRFYIKDRAGNESNKAETPAIVASDSISSQV